MAPVGYAKRVSKNRGYGPPRASFIFGDLTERDMAASGKCAATGMNVSRWISSRASLASTSAEPLPSSTHARNETIAAA